MLCFHPIAAAPISALANTPANAETQLDVIVALTPPPVKPDADLAAIIEKALPGLIRFWILKLTKDNPDITQDFLRQLGYLDTVREDRP